MNKLVEGLNGVKMRIDDISIVGRAQNKQEASTAAITIATYWIYLIVFEKRILKLNPDKIKFKAKSISYISHVITSEGLKSDPVKTGVKMP